MLLGPLGAHTGQTIRVAAAYSAEAVHVTELRLQGGGKVPGIDLVAQQQAPSCSLVRTADVSYGATQICPG